jgi:hypothetical protein
MVSFHDLHSLDALCKKILSVLFKALLNTVKPLYCEHHRDRKKRSLYRGVYFREVHFQKNRFFGLFKSVRNQEAFTDKGFTVVGNCYKQFYFSTMSLFIFQLVKYDVNKTVSIELTMVK